MTQEWVDYYNQVVKLVGEKVSMKGDELLEYVNCFRMDVDEAFDTGISPEDCANECF